LQGWLGSMTMQEYYCNIWKVSINTIYFYLYL